MLGARRTVCEGVSARWRQAASSTFVRSLWTNNKAPVRKEMRHSTTLRRMLESDQLEFAMEAHNGLSAKIVQNAGFNAVWASGLSMSAAMGLRDANEASYTQVLDVLEMMADCVTVPILVDGDTGYGNFNNARRFVHLLEHRNIAGVCYEDKLFPKANSLLGEDVRQPLASIDEFCRKIEACKEGQADPDFVVVARVEAFIAGWGMEEALKRAEAYRQAGADAILIHSKKKDGEEIGAFMQEWNGRHPVVLVPTNYSSVPTQTFRDWGASLVIWANHTIRASITAMEEVVRTIHDEQSLTSVEKRVVPVKRIFELQGEDELRTSEKKYLPTMKE
uniref:phosphoenolpyruvate mutase n=1 Tax=Palpitomonas bilix TaxID=652834 RepID=A0A7S3GEA3_9EUKA|mmetsp:Transcript_45719/g.118170  ORF Transcript_45719/g.118170 Transcript_45719/m.118170 type:complete len:334 (+) Transcript_45719:197-1198(+)